MFLNVGVEEEAGFSPLVGALEIPRLLIVDGFEADALVAAEYESDDPFAGVGHRDGVGGTGAVGGPAGDVSHGVGAHRVGGGDGGYGLDGAEGLEDSMQGPAVVVFFHFHVNVSGLVHGLKLPSGWMQV